MPAPIIDQTIPLNFHGLELRERHGHKEAYCKACTAWVRISEHYKGDRLVMRQIPHIAPCENYINFINEWKDGVTYE